MKTRFRIHATILVAATVIVANLSAPPAEAQQFSHWSAPVNLNNLKLSDGTTCPAVVNSSSNDNHPTISKDGLSLIFESNRPGPDSRGQFGLGLPDLWVTQRDSLDACWGVIQGLIQMPVNLGPVVNSAFM